MNDEATIMLNAWLAKSLAVGPTASAELAGIDAEPVAAAAVYAYLAGFWAMVCLFALGRRWRHRIAALTPLGLLCGAAGLEAELPRLQAAFAAGLPSVAWLGLLGLLAGLIAAAGASSRSPFRLRSALALALGLAFSWVSSYQYVYNVPMLNSPHLNIASFLLWGSGLFAVVGVNRRLETVVQRTLPRTALLWLIYIAALLVLEFIGYELLAIREVSKGVDHRPMVFGLIHGPWPMKVFYLGAGLLVVWVDRVYRASRLCVIAGVAGSHAVHRFAKPMRGPCRAWVISD
jgi:hypothetical protein